MSGPVQVAVSIDIESRGDDLIKHGILSIGYCVGRLDREEVLDRGRISLNPLTYLSYEETKTCAPQELVTARKTQQFEQRCLEEFWLNEDKNPGGKQKLQILMAEGVDPIIGIKKFRDLLDSYDDGVNFQAKIISDNIIFDGGWIDYYLSLAGFGRLQHDVNGRYRRVFDTVDYRRGVCRMDYGDKWMNEKQIIAHFGLTVNPDDHTHMPDDDAEYIYRFHVQLVNKINNL